MQLEYYLAETLGHKAAILQYKINVIYIYRNNINQNLINSLQATYPIILKQIGNNLFVQISKEYIDKVNEIINK